MVRTSIFSLCTLAICLRRILVLSLVFSIVYIALSNLTSPAFWKNSYASSSTQYLYPEVDEKQQISKRKRTEALNRTMWDTERNDDTYDYKLPKEDEQASKSLIDSITSPAERVQSNTNQLCPSIETNPFLVGHIGQATLLIEELEESEVEKANTDLEPGGRWKPQNCTARHKVVIVIPYRDRKSHLVRLLDFLIPVLKRQLLDFRFIVTEQTGEDLFNKGRIMNAAFHFGRQQLGVDCTIFHDVDMFPQDDRTPYGCPSQGPRHVGAFVSTLGYQLWYQEIVGGVLAINVQEYSAVNGFSNSYWAWGGEDDDMGKRILAHNFTIERPNSDFVRFSMLKHVKRKRLAPKLVYKLLEETEKRMDVDGLNEQNKWKLQKVDVRPLYYHLLVDVGEPPNEWKSS